MAEKKDENEITADSADAEAANASSEAVEETTPEESPAGEPAAEEALAEEHEVEVAAEADAAEASNVDAVDSADAESTSASASAEAPRKKKRLPRSQRPARTRKARPQSETRKPIVRLDKPESERGRRQERQGTVTSSAMDKTIVVKVDALKAHPKYKKVVRRSSTFHAHDESNQANVGDVVRIVETRPLSKTKRWRLVEIVEAAK